MLPLGHAAFGVVCYAAISVLGDRTITSHKELILLLGATQVPDLIDKPAVFYGLLSSGRAAGHSILGATVICGGFVLCLYFARQVNRPLMKRMNWVHPFPFVVGYVSHLIGDSYQALLAGRLEALSYLAWPFISPPEYPSDTIAPWVRLQRIYLGGDIHPQWMIILLAIGLYTVVMLFSRSERA